MILCGRSPRHLYVANALCEAAEVLAIVQESGSEWSWRKVLRLLRPDNFFRKAWRWLRDRRRYYGNPEARFFFGDASDEYYREKDLEFCVNAKAELFLGRKVFYNSSW